jgi:hypothetical protein
MGEWVFVQSSILNGRWLTIRMTFRPFPLLPIPPDVAFKVIQVGPTPFINLFAPDVARQIAIVFQY